MTMNLLTKSRKVILAGVALTACLGFTFNAQAQTCTIENWDDAATTGLADSDTGTQGSDNRRYGGPCGLQVDIDGTPRYVVDTSPSGETSYIARFYTFLDNAGGDQILLFAADDGTEDQIQVWYNDPNAGDLTLRVFDSSGTTATDLTESSVGDGWHSVELVWDAAASSDIRFSVDGAADLTASPDTSGLTIENAFLGSIEGSATGGTVDFDDFDSRRAERPGRLMVGDANNDEAVNVLDVTAIFAESRGDELASGQPDCNGDGSINILDVTCIFAISSE